jgi:hypothetical protein
MVYGRLISTYYSTMVQFITLNQRSHHWGGTSPCPSTLGTGGNGACTSHSNLWVVSGAGGGGFVGFNWSKPSGDRLGRRVMNGMTFKVISWDFMVVS